MSRFDYVQYDDVGKAKQADAKDLFTEVETAINTLADGRSKSLALTKLEEAYMWVGKAIRDEQIVRSSEKA
jgi:hypothetical protein